jgi:antimicrobial peptide system SdpA family protein
VTTALNKCDERAASSARSSVRLRAVIFFAYTGLLSIGLYVVAIAALPHSAIASLTPAVPKISVQAFAPQGWGFFTRDPEEPKMYAFKLEQDGTWSPQLADPIGSAKWWFGLDRSSRLQGVELGDLMSGAPARSWQTCERMSMAECLAAARLENRQQAVNTLTIPTLCGTIVVAQRAIVPWAWSSDQDEVLMPIRLLPLEVSC